MTLNKKTILYLIFCGIQTHVVAQFQTRDFVQAAIPFEAINDSSVGFNALSSKDGNTLYFSRTEHPENTAGEGDQDVWVSYFRDGKWSQPKNHLSSINSDLQDLIIGQSENTKLYVLHYSRGNESDLSEISAYKKQGDDYNKDEPIKLPNLIMKGSFFGFFVSADESHIIISMKGVYSFGKEDLYVCHKVDGRWSEPVHLGARINTSGFEMSPYLANDGRHLYFSSEGHKGLGSGDIYVSTRLDDTWQNWSKPLNLGPNINTSGFEAYFTLNEAMNEAYYFSDKDRPSGLMYRISYDQAQPEASFSPHKSASGFIRMKELPAMNVKLNLIDEDDQVVQSIETDEDGFFNLQSFLPDKNYKLALDDKLRNDLKGAEIFLTNDLGDKMVFMNEDELGIFGFKVLSGPQTDGVEDFELMASSGRVVDKPTTISGKVSSFGTLDHRVPLKIIDENENVIKTIETDENGYFSFSTDATEKSYFLSIDKSMTGLVDVYEVYLTNDNPEEDIVVSKTDKHLFEFSSLINNPDIGLSLMDETDFGMPQKFYEDYGYMPFVHTGDLEGFLKVGALPMMDTEILLMDEKDNLLGKVRTDSTGRFLFTNDLIEGDYKLKLTEDQSSKLKNSEIYLARNPDDILFYINDERNGIFAFKKLSRSEPISLYSLRDQTEQGLVVNEGDAVLKGKFSYNELPKKGITLRLLDEDENIVQKTTVNEDGEFEFDGFLNDKNYFISVEGDGLSDIYEIYLTGNNKNVLVNRTNKFVFAFKVLPSQDVLLTQAFEADSRLRLPRIPKYMLMGDDVGSQKRAYHEFDLNHLRHSDYLSLSRIVKEVNDDYQVVIRLYVELNKDSEKVKLRTIDREELDPVINNLVDWGVDRERIEVKSASSNQALLLIK
ncbi:MAG: hypothetical protein WEC59_07910 [Salibacteraceae bacterium]